ncbi:hypothetical protein PVK06_008768 [Gossypium arboreum]|uniref:Uncharacterized protein n=1 Tax=Gossypium arboreum TaxID=29729 RepID=A0ABR0QLT8_GOSAR|nr:hypothetical protein PVK06_008768 [Gossypium arboreum]
MEPMKEESSVSRAPLLVESLNYAYRKAHMKALCLLITLPERPLKKVKLDQLVLEQIVLNNRKGRHTILLRKKEWHPKTPSR